jgi:hypothetical protein
LRSRSVQPALSRLGLEVEWNVVSAMPSSRSMFSSRYTPIVWPVTRSTTCAAQSIDVPYRQPWPGVNFNEVVQPASVWCRFVSVLLIDFDHFLKSGSARLYASPAVCVRR